MKFFFSSTFLIASLIFLQVELGKSLKNRLESRQDAMTSLVIFAKGQAELNRDKQIKVLKGQNATAINKIDVTNLMKNTDSVNLEKMRQKFRNSTVNSTNSTTINTQPNNTQNRAESRNSAAMRKKNNPNKPTPSGTVQVSPNLQQNPNMKSLAEIRHSVVKEREDLKASTGIDKQIVSKKESEAGH